ncbi:unnamed protein product [Bathycoccus prasinos]
MGTARAREELRTARMHPGSANDVFVNVDERKNTTVRSVRVFSENTDCLVCYHATGIPPTTITKSFIQWRLPPEGGEQQQQQQQQQQRMRFEEIYMNHKDHDGLRYPLLNPLGEAQWSYDIKSYAHWPKKTKEMPELRPREIRRQARFLLRVYHLSSVRPSESNFAVAKRGHDIAKLADETVRHCRGSKA